MTLFRKSWRKNASSCYQKPFHNVLKRDRCLLLSVAAPWTRYRLRRNWQYWKSRLVKFRRRTVVLTVGCVRALYRCQACCIHHIICRRLKRHNFTGNDSNRSSCIVLCCSFIRNSFVGKLLLLDFLRCWWSRADVDGWLSFKMLRWYDAPASCRRRPFTAAWFFTCADHRVCPLPPPCNWSPSLVCSSQDHCYFSVSLATATYCFTTTFTWLWQFSDPQIDIPG